MDNIQAIEKIKALIIEGYISHSDLMVLASIAYAKEAADDVRYGNE